MSHPRSTIPSGKVERTRGSVLLIVLVTIVFATAALMLFLEKAGTDLIADVRVADAERLRMEAYSALETTVSVLEEFRRVSQGLHSPAEGWGDPLGFAGYIAGEGRTVTVVLEDESAKLPFSNTQRTTLIELFKTWELTDSDGERLADALLGWKSNEYVPAAAASPRAEDYERADLPFLPPNRSLRTFGELAAIDVVRQMLYDETGRPNALWHKFVATFSLYKFNNPNINGGRTEALLGFDEQQQQQIRDYLAGTGNYTSQGPGYFRSGQEILSVAGGQRPEGARFGTAIQAMRIIVTVREGPSSFELQAVIAPSNGATVIGPSTVNQANATSATSGTTTTSTVTQTSNSGTTTTTNGTSRTSSGSSTSLQYPFKLLEIRENAAKSPSAPAPDVAVSQLKP